MRTGLLQQRLMVAGNLLLVLMGAPLQWSGMAAAAPVVWAENRHTYEVVVSGAIDWTTANAAAKGVGGHLATITSQAENEFVFSLVNDPSFWFLQSPPQVSGPWLGGFRASSNTLDWQWVTGEPFDYRNWETNQPDNGSPGVNGEDALHFFAYGTEVDSTWNDAPHEATVNVAYLVEWEVPEPASLIVIAIGAITLTSAARQRECGQRRRGVQSSCCRE